MADNKELKPKSFRIDEEIAEKFKEISTAIGGSQQETFVKLIEAYEFQSGKAVLTEKKADIEQFEKYTGCLVRMYMSTLEDNQNLTETIRTEFDALLKSKEAIIQDLQGQLTVAKQLKEEATSKAKVCTDENTRLNNYIDTLKKDYDTRLEDMESMLSDKDSLNKALTASCNDLKAKLEGMKEAAEQTKVLQEKLEGMKEVEKEKAALEKQLEQEKTEHNKAITQLQKELILEKDKAILEVEKKYQEQMQKLKEKKQSEVDKYQQKYFDLFEKTKDKPETTEKATKVNSKK